MKKQPKSEAPPVEPGDKYSPEPDSAASLQRMQDMRMQELPEQRMQDSQLPEPESVKGRWRRSSGSKPDKTLKESRVPESIPLDDEQDAEISPGLDERPLKSYVSVDVAYTVLRRLCEVWYPNRNHILVAHQEHDGP